MGPMILAMRFMSFPWWMPVMADAAANDPQLSGLWVLELILKIFGGISLIVAAAITAYMKGNKLGRKQAQSIKVEPPIPTLSVQNQNPPHPSWDQHQAHGDRLTALEHNHEKLRDEQGKQFVKLLESGQERERIIVDKIDAVAIKIHERINQIPNVPHPAATKTRQS